PEGWITRKYGMRPVEGGAYRIFLWGFPKGATPHLAHDFAKQSVVCYTLCRRCRENDLPPGRARAFEVAGKQGCACVAWSRKRRSVFISRQGVYDIFYIFLKFFYFRTVHH